MKKTIIAATLMLGAFAMTTVSCKKDKKTPEIPSEEPHTPLAPEVITTLKIYIDDSLSNTPVPGSPFTFKDPDGDGGQPGAFLNNGADSLIVLTANSVYKTRVVILDESSNPVDSISNEIGGDESFEHMLFYNGNPANSGNNKGNVIINSTSPNYSVKLNGTGIVIRYTDTDNGASHGKVTRNIGLTTILKTAASTNSVRYPLSVNLRHQPDAKDGTYTPGETDIEIDFKIIVN